MSAARGGSAALSLLVCAALGGVGCDDPYRTGPAAPARATQRPVPPARPPSEQLADAPASGELPGRVPSALLDEPRDFPEAGRTPAETLHLAARLYGNWTSADAAAQLERLARLCVGQARAELDQAAAQAGADPQQRQARSRASVEAVDVDGTNARRTALVVTRQRVRAPDLPDRGWSYQVTTAQIERRGPKWVIAQWLPQP
jgi:hypothetical protein